MSLGPHEPHSVPSTRRGRQCRSGRYVAAQQPFTSQLKPGTSVGLPASTQLAVQAPDPQPTVVVASHAPAAHLMLHGPLPHSIFEPMQLPGCSQETVHWELWASGHTTFLPAHVPLQRITQSLTTFIGWPQAMFCIGSTQFTAQSLVHSVAAVQLPKHSPGASEQLPGGVVMQPPLELDDVAVIGPGPALLDALELEVIEVD
jgi:hypothetical protein